MAKMVSELGADVFDDTIVEKKSRFTKKQKNYIIGISFCTILAIALGLVYYFAATVWLIDFENMAYIQYAHNAFEDENGEVTAQISRVIPGQNYPKNFRIPAKINGYRITKIADGAFAGCEGIQTITMTDNINFIGDQAFAGCKDLKNINFSNKITHIGNEAFLNTKFAENLPSDSVVFANEVLIHVGADLLGDRTVLVSNPTRDIDRVYDFIQDGYTVFDMDTFTTLTQDNLTNYSSLAGQTHIMTQWMDGLFEDHDSIEIVEIPETLNFVPIKAFRNCSNLEKVIINGDDINEIREGAFEGCYNLRDIDIPQQITTIGDNVFKDTGVSLNCLPLSIQNLGVSVFENCSEITSFVYPKSLSYIPKYTFAGCSNLGDFSFEDENAILSIDVGAFEYTDLKSFRIPKNITNLNDSLFEGCESLEYIELYENTDKTIIAGTETVDKDTHTVSGTLQGVNQMRSRVFKGCVNFKTIKLYDKDGNVLSRCSDPATLYLPCTLERTATSTIGVSNIQTFVGTKVESVIFPKSIVNIGSYMFENVTTLENVEFVNSETSKLVTIGEGAFYGCTGISELSIPDSCSKIEMKAFQNCENLVSIHLPEPLITEGGFTSINQNLFDGCVSLTTINLRYGITQIAQNAFRNCKSLRLLYIPSTITSISESAFSGTSSDLIVISPILPGEEPRKWEKGWADNINLQLADSQYVDESETYSFNLSEITSDTLRIDLLKIDSRKNVSVVIPATISEKTVTEIAKNSFAASEKLAEITIPSTLTTIGERAFINCVNLTTINFDGTIAQWENVNKLANWNHGLSNNAKVICVDGEVSAL